MKFKFYQDVKVSIWRRQYFEIEAESKEAARKKAEEYTNQDVSFSTEVDVSEMLYDTEELIYPQENGGSATIEVYECNESVFPKYLNDGFIGDNSMEAAHLVKCPKCGSRLFFSNKKAKPYVCCFCGGTYKESEVTFIKQSEL